MSQSSSCKFLQSHFSHNGACNANAFGTTFFQAQLGPFKRRLQLAKRDGVIENPARSESQSLFTFCCNPWDFTKKWLNAKDGYQKYLKKALLLAVAGPEMLPFSTNPQGSQFTQFLLQMENLVRRQIYYLWCQLLGNVLQINKPLAASEEYTTDT